MTCPDSAAAESAYQRTTNHYNSNYLTPPGTDCPCKRCTQDGALINRRKAKRMRIKLEHVPAVNLYQLTVHHSSQHATRHMLTIDDLADLFDQITEEVVKDFRNQSSE